MSKLGKGNTQMEGKQDEGNSEVRTPLWESVATILNAKYLESCLGTVAAIAHHLPSLGQGKIV